MKQIIILLLIFTGAILGLNYESNVIKVDNNIITIQTGDKKLNKGSKALIVRNSNLMQDLIISHAKVLKVDDFKTELVLTDPDFYNKELPLRKQNVNINDKVISNINYNIVLPIVRNKEHLTNIKNRYPNVKFEFNDLFMLEIIDKKPTKKYFKEFCSFYNIGLIYINLDNKESFVDCYSGKIIYQSNTKVLGKNSFTPFYNSIDGISLNYELKQNYFHNLFKVKNDR